VKQQHLGALFAGVAALALALPGCGGSSDSSGAPPPPSVVISAVVADGTLGIAAIAP
jgi:hypothetical protein